MHLFNTVTIFVIFLMIGVEFSVSAVINPVIGQLEAEPQAKALSLFARLLGGVMPFWYGACFLVLAVLAWLGRGTAAFPLLVTAAGLWLTACGLSVAVLVPISIRIAERSSANWQQESRRWDKLHQLRVLLLAIAAFCLLWSL